MVVELVCLRNTTEALVGELRARDMLGEWTSYRLAIDESLEGAKLGIRQAYVALDRFRLLLKAELERGAPP
jgi:hypothetical protein